jgi:hypothetical protein
MIFIYPYNFLKLSLPIAINPPFEQPQQSNCAKPGSNQHPGTLFTHMMLPFTVQNKVLLIQSLHAPQRNNA